MKTFTFTYTKDNGDTSERTLLALVTPGGTMYAGIDLSSMPPEKAQNFAADAANLYDEYLADLKALQVEYDIKHNYRQFKAENISDLTEI
jgi:hypothetical protein